MPIQQLPLIGPKKTKYVVTIHDLAFKFFPQHFPWKDRWKINFFTDIAVRRADKIIAISHSTKKDLLKLYPKIKTDKIAVVYHGFDRKIFEQPYSKKELNSVLIKYNILPTKEKQTKTQYLLYVGAIQPRKDLTTLIKAFEKLKTEQKSFRFYKLVLVGEVAWKSAVTLKAVKQSKYKKDIILTGRVSFDDLAKFYQGAEVFIFPSLYEGFGIPLLEAFASRTPVITADNSSLREVGGDGARYFESGNYQALTQVLVQVLKSPTLKKIMVKAGLKECKKFSWEKCAKETLAVLKKI